MRGSLRACVFVLSCLSLTWGQGSAVITPGAIDPQARFWPDEIVALRVYFDSPEGKKDLPELREREKKIRLSGRPLRFGQPLPGEARALLMPFPKALKEKLPNPRPGTLRLLMGTHAVLLLESQMVLLDDLSVDEVKPKPAPKRPSAPGVK